MPQVVHIQRRQVQPCSCFVAQTGHACSKNSVPDCTCKECNCSRQACHKRDSSPYGKTLRLFVGSGNNCQVLFRSRQEPWNRSETGHHRCSCAARRCQLHDIHTQIADMVQHKGLRLQGLDCVEHRSRLAAQTHTEKHALARQRLYEHLPRFLLQDSGYSRIGHHR